jgi:hypothetical protein
MFLSRCAYLQFPIKPGHCLLGYEALGTCNNWDSLVLQRRNSLEAHPSSHQTIGVYVGQLMESVV